MSFNGRALRHHATKADALPPDSLHCLFFFFKGSALWHHGTKGDTNASPRLTALCMLRAQSARMSGNVLPPLSGLAGSHNLPVGHDGAGTLVADSLPTCPAHLSEAFLVGWSEFAYLCSNSFFCHRNHLWPPSKVGRRGTACLLVTFCSFCIQRINSMKACLRESESIWKVI